VKTVVLWKLDRLSRRLKDGITTLAEWSEKNLRIGLALHGPGPEPAGEDAEGV
jgi:hypothetical protein